MRTVALSCMFLLILTCGLAAGASEAETAIYQSSALFRAEELATVTGYLWDGSGVLLNARGKTRLVMQDRPGEFVELDWPLEKLNVLMDENGWRWPVRFEVNSSSLMLVARVLGPDLKDRIAAAWPLAHSGLKSGGQYVTEAELDGQQPVCTVSRVEWTTKGRQIAETARIELTSLHEKIGVPLNGGDRFNVVFHRPDITIDNWRDTQDEKTLLEICRLMDGEKHNIEIGPEIPMDPVFHPKLDMAAIPLEPREVTLVDPGGIHETFNNRSWDVFRSARGRTLVVDLTGGRLKTHMVEIESAAVTWHPSEPVLYAASAVSSSVKVNGRDVIPAPFEYDWRKIPDYMYWTSQCSGLAAYNVWTDEFALLQGFDSNRQEFFGPGIQALPSGGLIYGRGTSIQKRDWVLPDQDNDQAARKVFNTIREGFEPPTVRRFEDPPRFKLLRPTEPSAEDPGYIVSRSWQLKDGSGFVVVCWRQEPGESLGLSEVDTEIAVVGWDGEVKGRHRFPSTRGSYDLSETFENGGFRFVRETLPADGAKDTELLRDFAYDFDRECNLIAEAPVPEPYENPRFVVSYAPREDGAPVRVSDFAFRDSLGRQHSFKQAAGIEEDVRFFHNVGEYTRPWYFRDSRDWVKIVAVLREPLLESKKASQYQVEFWLWIPQSDNARLLWVGQPLGQGTRGLQGFGSWYKPGRSIWVYRMKSGSVECELTEEENGLLRSWSVDGSIPGGELVKFDLTDGSSKTIASGEISQAHFTNDLVLLCARLDGEDSQDMWKISANGDRIKLTSQPGDVEKFTYNKGIVSFRLVGEPGRSFTHRVNISTAEEVKLSADQQYT